MPSRSTKCTSSRPRSWRWPAAPASSVGTGGMRTKLEAAEKAAAAGIETILFNGRDSEVVNLLSRDLLHGTLLRTKATRLQARKYWLRHVPAVPGLHPWSMPARPRRSATRAHRCCPRASSMPTASSSAATWWRSSATSTDGELHVCRARHHASTAPPRSTSIARSHTREIKSRLGYSYGENVVHRDDLVTVHEPDMTRVTCHERIRARIRAGLPRGRRPRSPAWPPTARRALLLDMADGARGARRRPSSRPMRRHEARRARRASAKPCSIACAWTTSRVERHRRCRARGGRAARSGRPGDPPRDAPDKGFGIERVRVPLGVIAMIYEARPNVTADAAALCMKAGNGVILRGGSEAIHSNLAIAACLQRRAGRSRRARAMR